MLARMPEYAVNILIPLLVAIVVGLAAGAVLGFPHLSAVLGHAAPAAPSAPNPWGMIP
jgi:hypothetical protein